MNKTKIEWCDYTENLWHGCEKVSPACDNCYAESISNRFNPGLWGRGADRKMRVDKAIQGIKKLNRKAEKNNTTYRVFINSMSDFFEDREDLESSRIDAFYTFRQCKNLIFMLLTKRPDFANLWIRAKAHPGCLKEDYPNVWIGTTVENQAMMDKRLPLLLQIPASVRFISVEPMLGPVKIPTRIRIGDKVVSPYSGLACDMAETDSPFYQTSQTLDWVICGGESGRKARVMQAQWAIDLMLQCRRWIPFFMKQGSQANWKDFKDFNEFPARLQVREYPKT